MKRNHIIETIIDNGLIESGSVVIIGASGGPDSLCLLHALSSISDMYDLTLIPVHVNHMIRPEAEEECDHLVDICERLDLECQVYEASCHDAAKEMGVSLEEAGRNIRYQIFDEVADDLVDSGFSRDRIVIALGHNADDQAETILFRLLRGTGTHGLSGIPAFRISAGGNFIVRPLLSIERREIEAYIKENKLRPNIDKSNDDNTYTRNRIRNELIPYLEKNFNPKIKENLRRYAGLAYMDDSLLKDIAFREYSENITIDEKNDRIILDLNDIKDNPPSINSRVVSCMFELLGLDTSVTYEHVTAVMSLIYSENPSAGVDLPLGLRAYKEYDRLIISAGEELLKADSNIDIYPQVIMKKEFDPDPDEPYAAFDFDKFNSEYPGRLGDIVLRTRREGDYLPMKNGSKKIQDLLVDSKVRKTARESILLAAIDSEVLWVLPNEHFAGENEKAKGRFSQKFHIDNGTERVLLIELTDVL